MRLFRKTPSAALSRTTPLQDFVTNLVLVITILGVAFGLLIGFALIVFLVVRGVVWSAASALSYVGAIGWWVGVPLVCLALLETLGRLKTRDEVKQGSQAKPDPRRRRTGPLICAATAGILMSGNLALNIAASRVEEHYKSRIQHDINIYKNHDLAKLVGECVRLAILRHAHSMGDSDPAQRAALERIANLAPNKWAQMTASDNGQQPDPRVLALADAKLTDFITEPRAKALNQSEWLSMLTEWRNEARATAVTDNTLKAAASTVAEDFGITLREALKADFERGGKAWAAMQLDIAQQLLRRTPVSLAKDNPEITDALSQVKAMLADNGKAINALNTLITDVSQSQEAHAREVAENFTQVTGLLLDIKARIDVLTTDVRALDAKLEAIARNQQKQIGANPNAVPSLSDEDRKILDDIKHRGDALQKITAAAIERDFNTANALLAQLDDRTITDESFRYFTAKGDVAYFSGEFDKARDPYETALKLRSKDVAARDRAAIVRAFARTGDLLSDRRRAVELYEGTLELVPIGSTDWARTQLNLGSTCLDLSSKQVGAEMAASIDKAIAAFNSALTVYTKETLPLDYAAAQINLANTWMVFPASNTEELAKSLQNAIAAFEAGLVVHRFREEHPVEWMVSKYNLGNAWLNMPSGTKSENLIKSIAAYDDGLSLHAPKASPAVRASLHYNRAMATSALAELPDQNKPRLIVQAIASMKAAQAIFKVETLPSEHARATDALEFFRDAYDREQFPNKIPFNDIPATE
jgi:tetratricopeptide (TPR) repeat protein